MPAGDRTGPWSYGPRAGRGLGFCSGYRAPGHIVRGLRFGFRGGTGSGRGFGRGLGRGRGFGYPYGAAELTPEKETDFLEAEARQIRNELSAIEQRIHDLKREDK
ncbi:MAG: DUF5320 domain-containing protein [Candidatus Aminicenantes bacterium]|nr:DUF5320 domain-containing protein [Candidatus Aminicenantes bacterium]